MGPHKVILNESTEQYVCDLEEDDPEEGSRLRSKLLGETRSCLAKQYDHHLLNQNGKTVYPQAPNNPHPFSLASKEFHSALGHVVEDDDDTLSEKYFPQIHLGEWLDADNPLCYFLLLAHVTDLDPKDDATDNSKASEEQKTWEHIFSLLVRKLRNGNFERVDLFIFRAEGWFSAIPFVQDEPISLV
jgi:hypothetical protein